MNWVAFKAQTKLNKKCSAVKHTKIKGVPKLDDANDAGILCPQIESSLVKKLMSCHHHAVTILSCRWEELHRLHPDPY